MTIAMSEANVAGSARRVPYVMYGMRFLSDVHLPFVPTPSMDDTIPIWAFRRVPAGQRPPQSERPPLAALQSPNGSVIAARYCGPEGTWISNSGIGTFHIIPDCRRVDVYPEAGVAEHTLGLVLAGQVPITILHILAHPVLHTSGVVTQHGAVGFLGPKGQGKSSMAASFLQHGATLLTDDALPLKVLDDKVYGVPSLPVMKVWHQTAEQVLALPDELPRLLPNYEKRLLELDGRYAFAQEWARLRVLYVLHRFDSASTGHTDITLHALSKRDALTVLVSQTAWKSLLLPREAAMLLQTYAQLVAHLPFCVLSVPNGFEHQQRAYDRVMTDLEER